MTSSQRDEAEVLRSAAAHVFVSDLGAPALEERDLHHLARVLRLKPGEVVTASDGRGGLRRCRWAGSAELLPYDEEVVRSPPPAPPITIAFALTKGERPEWTVQKLTEVGADQIVLLSTARCIVRWAASDRHLERLREVARQAAMQSRRVWLPEVSGPLPFTDLEVGRSSQAGTGRPSRVPSGSSGGRGLGEPAPGGAVALAVPGGRPPELGTALLIGPEGGWTDEELAAVPIHVGLGPHVLRAETAALAAAVLLSGLRERLVAPAS